MKNNRHQCIFAGIKKQSPTGGFRNMSFKQESQHHPLFNGLGKFAILFLTCYLLSSAQGFSQGGDVINEGIFQVKSSTIVSSNSSFTNNETGTLNNDGELILRADLINFGSTGFDTTLRGLTRFEGFNEQQLLGNSAINLQDVLFANQVEGIQFLLENDLNIFGIANFSKGIIDNTNFNGNFTFNELADNINTSNSSYVSGPVIKLGTRDFVFPVGKGGFYRLAKIGNILADGSIYKLTYFLENSDFIYPHNSKEEIIEEIDATEYWVLDKTSTTGQDQLLTLSWNDATTPETIFETAADNGIAIVRWDEINSIWINEGGVADTNAKTVTTSINKNGFFTLARISNKNNDCDVITYSAVTANGDGINDFFQIDLPTGDCATNLNVMIFNRWGVKVFETDNYGLNGDVFDGISSGRLTINNSSRLPTGTYYYILDYKTGPDLLDRNKKAGYLYLSGN